MKNDISNFQIPKIQIYRIEKSLEQLIDDATNKKIIGENPLEHWDKNKLYAKLDIINLDIRIVAPDIKYTPLDIEDFKHHLEKLKNLKIIKPSNSKHKSAAMIVRNHAELVRGESRIVFNYKRLNDNTIDDSYKIPDKDMLINKIQGANIFSKFDLKSGFWQIRLHPDSIPWCAFTTPYGHYDWLVMSFGIKNAPSIFQRKMDTIFNNYYDFTCVYIDDILVFSKNHQEHRKHLSILFKIFIEEGLIISKKKMKLEQTKIDFLGLEIETNGKIKLQPHIAQKLIEFPNDLSDTKKLQQFLGVLNYTRNFYKNLSQDTQPLYNKLKKSGQKHFNKEDKLLVDRIKEKIKQLPELSLPDNNNMKIIQSDASKDAWGGILFQENKEGIRTLCRYASGTFKLKIQTGLDAEIQALIEAVDKFRIFLEKKFIIETDCKNIVDHYNKNNCKTSPNKMGQRRWLNLLSQITGNGYDPIIKYIQGKDNTLADFLSREK
jgi:hypothetical protein